MGAAAVHAQREEAEAVAGGAIRLDVWRRDSWVGGVFMTCNCLGLSIMAHARAFMHAIRNVSGCVSSLVVCPYSHLFIRSEIT